MTAVASTTTSPATKRWYAKRWGFRARGTAGTLIMAGFGSLTLFSPPLVSEGSWWATAWDSCGWVVFLAGAALRFWSTLYIGGRKTHALVCEGPYSVCRNPLYLGTFLLWLSGAIFFKSISLLVGVAAGILFYALVTVPHEEQVLRQSLGEAYADYCRRVPRFWPRLSLFRTPAVLQVNVAGLLTECRRASRWIWLPVLAIVLAQLRAGAAWPHWFNLP
ncbi:MAG TPA: isoprenylcysteine carboxylmethyltransferase family protein [Pirellulales bacterium]